VSGSDRNLNRGQIEQDRLRDTLAGLPLPKAQVVSVMKGAAHGVAAFAGGCCRQSGGQR
jgi:hypothetical protein